MVYFARVASQAAVDILEERPRADGSSDVRLRLVCGCEVRVALDGNRLITAEDGVRLVIGKYPCPKGHPVVKP